MNEIIKLILSLSLSGSILAVIIFLLKPFIKYKLSKSIQYYIWMVVLLRLVLPFSFEVSIMNDVFYGNNASMSVDSGNVVNVGKIAGSASISRSAEDNAPSKTNNGDTGYTRFLNNLFSQYIL